MSRSVTTLLVLAWVSSLGCMARTHSDQPVGSCLLAASPANVFVHQLDGKESVWLIDSRETEGVVFHHDPQLIDARRMLVGLSGLPSTPHTLQVTDLLTGSTGSAVPGYSARLMRDRDAVLFFTYSPADNEESLMLAPLDDLGAGTSLVNLRPTSPLRPRAWAGSRTAPVRLDGESFAFSDRWGRMWTIDLETSSVADLKISGCDPLGYLERTGSLFCRRRDDGNLLEVDLQSGEVDDHGVEVGSRALVLPQHEWILFSDGARWVLPERSDLFAYDPGRRKRHRLLKGVDLRSGEVVPCDAFDAQIQARFRPRGEPGKNQIAWLALVGPLLIIAARQVWCRMRGAPGLAVARFVGLGCLHGCGLFALLLWSESHAMPDDFGFLIAVLGLLFFAIAFGLVYLGLAGVVWIVGRLVGRLNKTDRTGIA